MPQRPHRSPRAALISLQITTRCPRIFAAPRCLPPQASGARGTNQTASKLAARPVQTGSKKGGKCPDLPGAQGPCSRGERVCRRGASMAPPDPPAGAAPGRAQPQLSAVNLSARWIAATETCTVAGHALTMVAGLSARSAAGPALGAEPGRAVASGSETCASRPPVTEVTESGNPIRRSGADVCPVPTRIVLSYLTLWVQRSSSASWRGPLAWRQRTTASGAGAVTYI